MASVTFLLDAFPSSPFLPHHRVILPRHPLILDEVCFIAIDSSAWVREWGCDLGCRGDVSMPVCMHRCSFAPGLAALWLSRGVEDRATACPQVHCCPSSVSTTTIQSASSRALVSKLISTGAEKENNSISVFCFSC